MKVDIDAIDRLKALVERLGNQKLAAEHLGVTPPHVGDLLRGRRTFSDAMLAKLGLRRTVIEAQRKAG
jgi:plasmid maintenance system antidote protein VapI